jgi:hypothetical protein
MRRGLSLPCLHDGDRRAGTAPGTKSARKAQGIRTSLATVIRIECRCLSGVWTVRCCLPGKSHKPGSIQVASSIAVCGQGVGLAPAIRSRWFRSATTSSPRVGRQFPIGFLCLMPNVRPGLARTGAGPTRRARPMRLLLPAVWRARPLRQRPNSL